MSKGSEFDRVERLIDSPSKLDPLIQEKDESISILVVGVKTAEKRREQGFDKMAHEAQ